MPECKKILIIGNGFGGTYTLKNLRKLFKGNRNVELSLIGDRNYFLFTPLLHEVATGGVSPQNIVEPVRKVLGHCLKKFYVGKAEYIDLEQKQVTVGKNVVSYDYLVLAPGAETNFYGIPGADKFSITLKSLDCAVKLKNNLIDKIENASSNVNSVEEKRRMLSFVVVGGGPTGVELVAELEEFLIETLPHYYEKEVIDYISITLIERGKDLVAQFGEKIRRKSLDVLQKKGIKVLLNTAVTEVTEKDVTLGDGTKIETENVIWLAGVKPNEIKFSQNVSKSENGKLLVNEFLELKDHPGVFALGDVALFMHKDVPLPALAQVAEKQAKGVARNIKRLIGGGKPKAFVYRHSGNLMSLGQWMAVGEFGRIHIYGRLTWLLWRIVYLSKLLSLSKKLEVGLDWAIDSFTPRDISKI